MSKKELSLNTKFLFIDITSINRHTVYFIRGIDFFLRTVLGDNELKMKLKGIEKLREKLPSYPGKKILFFPILATSSFFLGLISLLILDVIPRFFPTIEFFIVIEPIMPILGTLMIGTIGFLCIFKVWHSKEKYLKKFKEFAYQRAFKFGLIGVPIVFVLVLHAYIPYELLPPSAPVNGITVSLSTSLLSIIAGFATIEIIIRIVGSFFFIFIGLLTMRRAIFSFGIDYMAVVYLYYPEESEVQEHEIYSILRHPTYLAILLFCLGGFFARFSLYSIFIFAILLTGLLIHIRLVEEKELIKRFGDSYLEYRKKVPALLVRPKNLGKYFKFLIKAKK